MIRVTTSRVVTDMANYSESRHRFPKLFDHGPAMPVVSFAMDSDASVPSVVLIGTY